jgi:hypothetical protein
VNDGLDNQIKTLHKMDYSPKLRMAMKEIKDILEKNDIAGLVVLHTPGHGEYTLKLNPSYSALKFEQALDKNGELVHGIRLKVDDISYPDPKERKQALSDTLNMVEILCNLSVAKADSLISMSESFQQAVKDSGIDVDHNHGKNTDSREIDN